MLTVVGNAQLDGILRVSFADGYMPAAGDQFSLPFLLAGSMSGGFSEIDLPALPAGESWVSSDIPQGRLTVVPEPSGIAVAAAGHGLGDWRGVGDERRISVFWFWWRANRRIRALA